MRAEKTDRRIKYTKQVLKESLIKLLQTHHIAKISVKMLCKEADINRSTFYAHYSDQYELLRTLELEIIEEFRNYIKNQPVTEQLDSTVALMKQLLEYAAQNADLFRVLLNDHGDREFIRDIMTLTQEQIILSLKHDQSLDQRTSEYLQCFIVTGALKIVQKWIEEGSVESPQEMAELISGLLFKGVSSFFS